MRVGRAYDFNRTAVDQSWAPANRVVGNPTDIGAERDTSTRGVHLFCLKLLLLSGAPQRRGLLMSQAILEFWSPCGVHRSGNSRLKIMLDMFYD